MSDNWVDFSEVLNFRLSAYGLKGYPKIFYRVRYPGAQASYSAKSGFRAQGREPYTLDELRNAFNNHFDWDSGIRSPFISVLSSFDKAKEFAQDRSRASGQSCYIMQIDIDRCGQVVIFNAVGVCNNPIFNIRTRRGFSPAEYLIYGDIPSEAIVYCLKVEPRGMKSKQFQEAVIRY
jgi:hypothetical protein